MKRLRWLFLVYCVEGLAALLWTFFTPSESGQAALLWFSPQRLLLLAFLFALCGLLATIPIWLWRSPLRAERLDAAVDDWCLAKKRLTPLLVGILIVVAFLSVSTWAIARTPLVYSAYQDWAPETFPLLHALVVGLLPLLVLVLLIVLQGGAYLAVRYRRLLAARDAWTWERLAPSLILILLAIAAIYHWAILGFQLRFFASLPAWYWKIEMLTLSWRDLAFAAIVVVILGLAYWVLMFRQRQLFGLILLFILSLVLQMGVGIMSGAGLATVAERYFSTYHATYIFQATQNNVSIMDNVRRYEELHIASFFTRTKPPGLVAFYIGLDRIVNRDLPHSEVDMRRERLMALITLGFPIVAASMVFLIFAFARRFLPEHSPWLRAAAPLLYVLCPNVVLFSLFPDQAIYPLLFLLGVWFAVFAVRSDSLAWAFALGVFLYAAAFFAFTMLPLYPFVGVYTILHCLRRQSGDRWKRLAWTAVAIGAGTLVLYLLGLRFLNYDFFPRFEKTVAINHAVDFYQRVHLKQPVGPESLSTRLGQIARAAWFNNLDFAAAMGFPIYILFIVQGIQLVRRAIKGVTSSGDIILLGLLSSFVVLILAGTAQGETPRLWLFWMPMVVLLAALELEAWCRKHPSIILWVSVVQFITILLMFHFQDLRM